MRIQERLRRSVRDVHTHHFNRGVLEHDSLEFEDMDDVVQTLWHRAEEALVRLDEAERVVEDALMDEGCLDVDKCPHWVEWHDTARAYLAKLRKEQDDGK